MPPPRITGIYDSLPGFGPRARAFVPHPLPPADPPLLIKGDLAVLHERALAELGRLRVAAAMVPDPTWFLYGFVRKEAVLSSQIEGTQATLRDVATFESEGEISLPDDVEEVCNYVAALNAARDELAEPNGRPLGIDLLASLHTILMRGARGGRKSPGAIRHSQNWIGGRDPATARFVPPPPERVRPLLADLDRWVQQNDPKDPLPPLVRAGLAHVQFETIHPFLDGNGRIGRMLITLLVERWGLLHQPLLYLSVAFKRRRREYYDRLTAVREEGDWEGWTAFFLECVREAAVDGVAVAGALQAIMTEARRAVADHPRATVAAVRLVDRLPAAPIVTVQRVAELLDITPPTARKAIELLQDAGVLGETTGRQRDRVYAFERYLHALTAESDTQATDPGAVGTGGSTVSDNGLRDLAERVRDDRSV